MIDPSFLNEDGSLKNSKQLAEQRRAKEKANKLVAIEVERRTPKAVVSPYAARIGELNDRLRFCRPSERAAIEMRLRGLEKAHKKWQAEQAESARIQSLAGDDRVRLLREHAAALGRSFKHSHPDVDENHIQVAVALAQSNDLAPDALHREYWSLVAGIDAKQYAAEDNKVYVAREQAAKAQADASQQELQTAKAFVASERSKLESQQ